MEINRSLLREAAKKGLLTEAQSERLWEFFSARTLDQPTFRTSHILYYLGGMLAIGAMSLFMNLGWELFGGRGLLFISLGYGLGAILLTEYLLGRRLLIPAGIIAALVVVLTPLAVYGLQEAMGWWADGRVFREYHTRIDWRWIFMELATLIAGAVMFWRYRLPFLMMPVAVTLWYMSMDLVPLLFGVEDHSWELRRFVSLWFGLAMTLLAFWVDIRNRSEHDYAFWLYLFGVLAFWGGLSLMKSDSETGKFLYFIVNLTMIAIAAMLSRRVFAVFGGIGVAGYVGHLAYDLFEDTVFFPFVLTGVGLGVIYLGILWQRHEGAIAGRLRGILPQPLKELVERGH